MKRRGIAVVIGLLAVVGGIVFWKLRDRDTAATQTVTQASGSAAVTPKGPAPAAQVGRITVTVSGDKGPLADAIVRIAPERGDVLAIKTDVSGVAIADKLAVGTYAISASATGFEPAALDAHEVVASGDAKLTITLKPGGRTLSGIVTDVSGGPIAGARIDAAKLGQMARPDRAVASTLTGADGTYRLAVAEGQLLVAARSADYAAQSRLVDVGVAGATADFALVPGGVIEGIVVDEKTRDPVAGAIVTAKRDSSSIMLAETGSALVTAGVDGTFRIAGLRPGAYELDAVGGGKRSKSPTIVGLGIAEQVGDVEILVGTSPAVRGTVVDDNGAPIAAAKVRAFGPGGGEEATADEKGAFVMEGLAPGKYMLVGSSEEHLGSPSPIEMKDKDVDGVVVRMRRASKIAGRVEPPQICDIANEAAEPRGRGGMRMLRLTGPVASGADGKFEIGPVEEVTYSLEARCASGDTGTASVAVKPGTSEVVIAVKPGATIAGKVVDGEGKPVAGVSVMASPQDGGESTMIVNGVITSGVQALTNGAGAYEVRGLAAGVYRLSVLDRGKPMKMKTKPPQTKLAGADKKTGVDMTVDRPNGVIEGIVTGPDGKPLADAWVSVHQDLEAMLENMANDRDEPGRRTMMMRVEDDGDEGGVGGASSLPPALTDAQGRFEIRNLPHAKYEVTAEAQAGKLRGRLPRVEPDADVQIQALGVSSLSGTVKGAAGATPLFTIEIEGPTRAQRTFTDGTFALGRVDPGVYKVRVTSSDGNAEQQVEVKPATPATVDITLVANAIVIGTVVDGAGKPVAGVPVLVVPDEGEGRLRISMSGPPITSGPDGKFRVEHKAGKGVLVAMMQDGPPVMKRGLALEAGKVLDVGTLTLDATPPPP